MTHTNPILHAAAGWILTDKAILLPESHLRALFHRLKTEGSSGDDARVEKEIARATTISQIAAVNPAQGIIACIPICGVLNKAYDGWGMCSTTRLLEQLQGAVADPAVSSIVLDVDSPGGFVNGSVEFADAVRAANQLKPVTAVVRGLCCSGAYWIASQCAQIISRPECEVGNIGVYSVLMDVSKFYAEIGISLTTVASGQFKGLGADGKVTDDLIADTRRIVTGLYQQFVAAVAQGRGIDIEQATDLADGRAFLGPQARKLNLIDALASSFSEAIDISTGEISPESETSAMANATKTQGPPPAAAVPPNPTAAAAPPKSEQDKDRDKGGKDSTNVTHKVLDATIESAKGHRSQVRAAMDHAADMEGEADDATKSKAKAAVASLKATSEEAGRCAKAWLSKIDDSDGDGDDKDKPKPDNEGDEDKSSAAGGARAAAAGDDAASFIAAFGDKGAVWFVQGKPFRECAAAHIAAIQSEYAAATEKLKADHKVETDSLKAENAELKKKLSAMPRGNEEALASTPEGTTAGPKDPKGMNGLSPRLQKFADGLKFAGQTPRVK